MQANRAALRFTEVIRLIHSDVHTPVRRDPACKDLFFAICSSHTVAMTSHRLAHYFHRRGNRLPATLISFAGKIISGVEIHPNATIGHGVFIDHGVGVVIGEQATIGDDVLIYHGVTIGAKWSPMPAGNGLRRHPEIGARSRLGCNSAVLGGIRIGTDVTVDAGVVVSSDQADGSRVRAPVVEVALPVLPTSGNGQPPLTIGRWFGDRRGQR